MNECWQVIIAQTESADTPIDSEQAKMTNVIVIADNHDIYIS
jgi:hypothetical protein